MNVCSLYRNSPTQSKNDSTAASRTSVPYILHFIFIWTAERSFVVTLTTTETTMLINWFILLQWTVLDRKLSVYEANIKTFSKLQPHWVYKFYVKEWADKEDWTTVTVVLVIKIRVRWILINKEGDKGHTNRIDEFVNQLWSCLNRLFCSGSTSVQPNWILTRVRWYEKLTIHVY